MLSSRHLSLGGLWLFLAVAVSGQTSIQWGNSGSDFTLGTSWVGGTAPSPTGQTTNPNIAELGTTGTILFQPTINSTFSVDELRISSGASSFNIGGTGTLNLGVVGLDNEATTAQTISVPIAFATTAPSIFNAGNLTLSGSIANNATPLGLTITNNGTLLISGNFENNATMGVALAGSGSGGAVSGVVSGAGTVTVSGSGKWAFSGSNTYTGATTLNGGTLVIGTDANLGAVPSSATAGSLTFNGGTLETTATMALASNRGIALGTSGGSIQTDGGTTLTYSGVMAGSGNLNKAGSGTLLLSGANANTGRINVQSGTLQDGAANAFSSSSQISIATGANLNVTGNETIAGLTDPGTGGNVTITTGATLRLDAGGVFNGVVTGGGALALAGSTPFNQTLTNDNNNYTGGTSIGGNDTLQVGVGGATGAIPTGNITVDGTLLFNRQGNITYGGISGNGSIQQVGTGTLILSGSNTYSNGTFIGNGTITDQSSGAFSPNSTVFLYGGSLVVAGNETIHGLGDWVVNSLTSPGNVTIESGALLTLVGGSAYSGGIGGAGALKIGSGTVETLKGAANHTGGTTVQSGGTLQIGDGGTSGSVSGSLVVNGNVTFNRSDAVTYSGITGSGSLKQNGSGTLTLSGTNSYTGSTFVSGGTLTDANAGAFASGPIFINAAGATLNVAFNESIGALGGLSASIGSNTTIATGATLTIHNGSLTYLGTISGNGSIVLTGSGSQTFGGSNTYTGGTTINAGTLFATNTSGSATGSGNVTIAGGATLQLGNGGSGGNISGDISNSGTFSFFSTGNITYGGVISGSGRLSVGSFGSTTTGALILTGQNSYTGQTSLNSGTLVIGTDNALPTGTTLSFASGAALNVANSQTVARPIGNSGNATIQIAAGKTLTFAPTLSTGGGSFDGTISGAGALVIAGATGTGVALDGISTYSGGTIVSGGTLYLGSNTSSDGSVINGPAGTGSIAIQSGAALSLSKLATGDTKIANNVTLADNTTLSGVDDNALILAGNVTAPATAATVHLGGTVEITGLLQASAGSTALTFDSGTSGKFANLVLLGNADPSISSVTVNSAGVIFGAQGAVPTVGTTTLQASTGYVGIASFSGYTTPTIASVLALIPNRGTFSGTLGFDTADGNSGPHVFTDNIDLTGFSPGVTLGSLSKAVLTGTITPAASGYALGNGGGVLVVQSALTGANSVTVASLPTIPDNGLTAVFQGANSFTGNLTVSNSLAVLDSASALPAGQTVSLGANGYVSYTEAFTGVTSFSDFITHRLVSYTPTSIIGLDSHDFISDALTSSNPSGERYDGETIDLSGLGPVYLGTATQLVLNGPIIAPNQGGANKTLSLLAAGDGVLVISSPLTANNVSSVVVGSSTAAFGNGTVVLAGGNTYTGGTVLNSGLLVVTEGSKTSNGTIVGGSLGTGTLTVAAGAQQPVLAAGYGNYVEVDNAIQLGSALQVGLPATQSSDTASVRTNSLSSSIADGVLALNGVIGDLDGSHTGSLNVYNDTILNGTNTFTGGVNLYSGALALGNDAALGTGTLTISPGSNSIGFSSVELDSFNGARTLANNIVYNGSSSQFFGIYSPGGMTVNGSLTLNNSLSLAVWSDPVTFNGALSGSGRLMVDFGEVVLNPSGSAANTAGGGLESVNGLLILANANAIPASPTFGALTADASGYLGISFVPGNVQSTFLDRFNKGGTSGTIGFDSPSISSPNTFNTPISLTGFASSARLGSATSAILGASATITPQGNNYNFGGGGGTLEVGSALTDDSVANPLSPTPRGLLVTASNGALTLRLTGANSYTGGTIVQGSAVIFGASSVNSNPLPTTGSLYAFSGAYIGTEDSAVFAANPTTFVNRFSPTVQGAIVGFDSFNTGSPFVVTGNISLANFTSSTDPAITLGTATNATINGSITLPGAQSAYRFAGYKGGQLTVGTTLTSGSVVIGNSSIAATFGSSTDANAALSGVTLSGNNSYSGGTTLNAGVLNVGNDNALGTGALTVNASYGPFDQHVGLFASGAARTLANDIALSGYAPTDIGGVFGLTLNGVLSGSGDLDKVGSGVLTLAGNNTGFSGDIYVQGGSVTFVHGNSIGTGALEFGVVASSATFLESTTVNGLYADNSADTINLGTGTTLSVHQTFDSNYDGTFAGSNIALNFDGTDHHLWLNGASSFTGSTTIQNGVAIIANNANAFGASTNTVTVSGGKLGVDKNITLANPVVLNSGKIGGLGTFQLPAGSSAFDIKSGITLAPGLGGPGKITFDGSLLSTSALILDSGGNYNWQIMDATTSGGWDRVVVNGNVDITATNSLQFNFSLISLNADGSSGNAANFDPSQAYSWTVLSASHINGFTGTNQFSIDQTSFLNPNVGTFSFSLDSTQSNLVLNFSPVPEPSTYALMFAGLGLTFFASRRHRRRS